MIKRIISIALAAVMALSLTACASNETKTEPKTEPKTTDTHGKILVAYFSWSGNTKEMAEYIAEQTNGELYEIKPLHPYPDDYDETGEIAKIERDENQRPEIAEPLASLDQYDTIFIGYPIWWHTAPMIIGTFLESYELKDKSIYPFTQSASMDVEQFENSMSFIKESAKSASVYDGLFVSSSDTDGIQAYLIENGFLK